MRCGGPGVNDAIKAGFSIGLSPVLKFALPHIKEKVGKEVMRGEKVICLAISDPNAGSDVAGLTCTAKLTEDGKHYIVNGTKKWITNGTFADYFVTAVRTGDEGIFGISMLLIERSEGNFIKLFIESYLNLYNSSFFIYYFSIINIIRCLYQDY